MAVSGGTGPRKAQSDLANVQDRKDFWADQLARVERLSAREAEVFQQLGDGCSNREIARRLGITERTVKAHVAQIMIKLGVESRLQAGLVSLVHYLMAKSSIDGGAGPAGG